MRTLFIIPLVLMSLVSFPSWGLSTEDLVIRAGLYYAKFTATPFTGEVDEGLYRGSLRNGKREGSWKSYYGSGMLSNKGEYKNNELEGSWESHWDNGQLSSKGNSKSGNKEGSWESYYDSGQLISKGDFKNGNEEGYWVHYNEDGSVVKKYTGTFKNGVKVSE